MLRKFIYFLSLSLILISCATVPPQVNEFQANPERIEEGSKTTIYWNVIGADEVSIEGIGSNLMPIGSKEIVLDRTTTFKMLAKKGNEEVTKILTVDVYPKEKPKVEQIVEKPKPKPTYFSNEKNYPFSQGEDDGRFTIGAIFTIGGDGKRLMFGYPVPLSTSHFIVSVNGKFASNNPYFQSYYHIDNVKYISSIREVKGQTGSIWSQIIFEFEGVKIIQKLIPVDSNFVEVPVGSWGQHYKIEYEIINLRDGPVTVGLLLLIDTMIDENDDCRMTADNTNIDRETIFEGNHIPKVINVYRKNYDKKDMYSIMTLGVKNEILPDKLYIGNWPYFHSVLWDININNDPYYDSAIFLKWENKNINSLDSISFVSYYGLPKQEKIRTLFNTPNIELSTIIYFPPGSTSLDIEGKKTIESLIQNKKILGVVVEGFGDAVGNDKLNMDVSRRRALNTRKFMSTKGIDINTIIPKAYGESFADQSKEAQKFGAKEDRKVKVTLYIENK